MLKKLIKLSLIFLIGASFLNAQDLKNTGVAVTYLDFGNDEKKTTIKRIHNEECKSIKVSPNII